jgi:hypothetical protein
VLEHRAADHRVQLLAGQAEPVDQAAERRGEHVLGGRAGVGAVGTREGDAIATEDGDATSRAGVGGCGLSS